MASVQKGQIVGSQGPVERASRVARGFFLGEEMHCARVIQGVMKRLVGGGTLASPGSEDAMGREKKWVFLRGMRLFLG